MIVELLEVFFAIMLAIVLMIKLAGNITGGIFCLKGPHGERIYKDGKLEKVVFRC